ncbi:hypothetical protein [Flavobacterium sp.]|uniref:hypothetical protein n=1 Tax=Flavobacterium sp. TaxID=239 RepID=UPI002ED8EC04
MTLKGWTKAIKSKIRQYIRKKLFKKGFEFKRLQQKEKILTLIKELHPLKTQHNLIRIGPNRDGGYLVPDDLEGIEACFSPGVDCVSEFELECINRGMKIFMADKTIEKPNLSIPKTQYSFIKKHIGLSNNDEYITMDSWVNQSLESTNSELLLQMDIEGFEYYAILNMSYSLMNRFRIMVFEFHFLEKLWNSESFDFYSTIFNKILETHVCVHIHPNNHNPYITRDGIEIPPCAEFTFIRKDRAIIKGYQNKFPNSLDFDNTNRKPMILSKTWYS